MCYYLGGSIYVQKNLLSYHLNTEIFTCSLKYFTCTFFQKRKLFLKETLNNRFCSKSLLTGLNYYLTSFHAYKINYIFLLWHKKLFFKKDIVFNSAAASGCKNLETILQCEPFYRMNWNGTYFTWMPIHRHTRENTWRTFVLTVPV